MPHSMIDWLTASARRRPGHPAVEEGSGASVTFAELDELSDLARDGLRACGVRKGDRVGVYLSKSIDAYAAILGVLKAGAAYVPIDQAAPFWRTAFITHDCGMAALVIDQALTASWRAEAEKLGPLPALIELPRTGGGRGLREALHSGGRPPAAGDDEPVRGDDLAYILYTSGSTGTPKGVMLTHTCAVRHVDWCSETFGPTDDDRFSSHAPFHFDLSITDLYVPLKHGATVLLIDAEQAREPVGLGALIASRRLTIWYSTPTALTVLAEFGRLDRHDVSALRCVLFAGEVFPPKHLRAVKALVPNARFFNLYGPTETNVCTCYALPDALEPDRSEPYPIGSTCAHFLSRVVDAEGRDVPPGHEGELVIHGDGMLQGYFNNAARTAAAFLIGDDGRRWYRTGDLVVADPADGFIFVGRRDRMVKRKGYRIELGEIEAGLYRHPAVKEAAVVARTDDGGSVRIIAHLGVEPGGSRSEIQMRAFCADVLPGYMMPDAFRFVDALPRTSTDKIDYQRLAQVV